MDDQRTTPAPTAPRQPADPRHRTDGAPHQHAGVRPSPAGEAGGPGGHPTVDGTDTGAHGGEAAHAISGARDRVDELDSQLIALVRERMAVSADIQRQRIASGGRRVHLSREMRVIQRYREGLGKPGSTLAMTLLELCRGRV